MKGEFTKKVMGSNPEFEKLICSGVDPVDARYEIAKREKIMTDWTEKDGIWTLERGGVSARVVFFDGIHLLYFKMGFIDQVSNHPSAEDAKSAVEEILSLLQPKAKELVWEDNGEFLKGSSFKAIIPSGFFSVGYLGDDKWTAHCAQGKGSSYRMLANNVTLEEAQAACQSHFNALVQEMIDG